MFRNTLLFIFVILSFAKISLAKEIVIHDKLFIATMNDIYTNLDDYGDILVTFEGNLVRGSFDDPEFEGTEYPFVYRLGPGCCYNDLYAGMYLEYYNKYIHISKIFITLRFVRKY